MKLVNVDQYGHVSSFKEDNGKFYLIYTIDDYRTDRIEISKKFYKAIVDEFGNKDWNK